MDDRSSHFFALVGEVCDSARLADLPVRLRLKDGSELEDHPRPAREGEAESDVDDTGYADGIDVGETRVPLSDVVLVSVRRPESGA